MLERDYQRGLIKRIKQQLPGCMILKNDSGYIQGIPDLTILYGRKWAVLEVKPDADAAYEPNQEFYLEKLGGMSFSATIHPANEEEVLDELQQALQPRRASRHA